MLVAILIIFGVLSLLVAIGVVTFQYINIKKGIVTVDENFNGPEQVSATVHAILRFLLRRSIHFRKFLMQYILHVFVRVMYYIDRISYRLYAKSRTMFVTTAVKNRGTVPHFWNHLKVYKQEMDREKEMNDE